jgi:tetratricopeptide (TPR) repeat protein
MAKPRPKLKAKPKQKPPSFRPASKPKRPAPNPLRWLSSIDRGLLVVLIVAALIRAWGIGDRLPDASLRINVIDDSAIEETDRTNIMRAWAMWRGGMKDFELNPHTGGWPALPFYLTLGIQVAYKAWYGFAHASVTTEEFANKVQLDSAALFLLARIVNAVIGVASVALTWRLALALPLAGRAAALLAALFMALNPLHVLTSQHISDPNLLALVFVALAAVSMARVAEGGGLRDSALAGVWIGLAGACKYVPLVLLLPLAVAHARGARWKAFAVSAGLVLAAMFIASPYTFLDLKTTTDAFTIQRKSLFSDWVGQSAFPISLPTYLIQTFPQAMGWPAYLAALLGLGVMWREPGARVVSIAAIVIVVANGMLRAAQERYLLAAYPLLMVAAGVGALRLYGFLAARAPALARGPAGVAALAALCALAPFPSLVGVRAELRKPDSRHEARRWIDANVDPSRRLAVELYGPVFSERERNVVIWPFFATQAPLVAPAYHAAFLDGIELICLSGEISRRFDADSVKYPVEAAYYRWLRANGGLLWRSDPKTHSGPALEVRALPKRISTRAERDSLFARVYPRPTGTHRLGLWCHDMSALFAYVRDQDRSLEWAERGLRVGAEKMKGGLYSEVALAKLNLGDPAGAEEAARRGIEHLPRSFALRVYRGMALEQLGRYEEALAELRDGLNVSGDARIRLNLGQLLASMGRYEEAVEELRLVPNGIPEGATARRDLAVILLNRLGRREEGIEALREAAALTTNPGEATLLREELERLERGRK